MFIFHLSKLIMKKQNLTKKNNNFVENIAQLIDIGFELMTIGYLKHSVLTHKWTYKDSLAPVEKDTNKIEIPFTSRSNTASRISWLVVISLVLAFNEFA